MDLKMIKRSLFLGSEDKSGQSVSVASMESTSKSIVQSKPTTDEVIMLRREIEAMKFYQELEQSEYQEMKDKMVLYETKMAELEKQQQLRNKGSVVDKYNKKLQKIDEESTVGSNVDTLELLDVPTKNGNVNVDDLDVIVQKKIQKRDAKIVQLKAKLSEKVHSSSKLKELATEYESRLNALEQMKEEEIEEIKEQYKAMLAKVAKQCQNLEKRTDDEIQRSDKLRALMEEMRDDMALREEELEKQIKSQQEVIKKNETMLSRALTKVDLSSNQYNSTLSELEKSKLANHEEKKKVMELKREMTALQASVEKEISSLTGKLLEVERKFDEEVLAHEKTTTEAIHLEEELAELKKKRGITDDQLERLRKLTEDRAILTNELQLSRDRCNKAEMDLKLLRETISTNRNISKEHEGGKSRLKVEIEKLNKEIKTKDYEFVRAKKKWNMTEQKLNEDIRELNRIKDAFDAWKATPDGNKVISTAAADKKLIESQQKLIEQLRNDKATLKINLASTEGKKDIEIAALKKELEQTRKGRDMKEDKQESRETKNTSVNEDRESIETFASSNYVVDEKNSNSFNEFDDSRHEVQVDISENEPENIPVNTVSKSTEDIRKGMTGQRSYRNFARQKKLTLKKVTVDSE